MNVEIITPEEQLFAGEAKAIQLPGKDGLFQILDNHAPIIATLSKGTVKIDLDKAFERKENTPEVLRSNGSVLQLDIQNGVIEMSGNKAIVLVN